MKDNDEMQAVADKIIDALIGCTVQEAEYILQAVKKQLKVQAVIGEAES